MKKKIKVLHIFGGMNCGGAETLIMNVFRNIDREVFCFDFAVQTQQKCFYDDEIEKLGGKIIHLPSPREKLFLYGNELKKAIENYGPYDVIHSHVHYFSGFILKLAKSKDIPVRIAHSHNTYDGKKDSLIRNIYRIYMRILIKNNATYLLGCSKAACESLFGKNCWIDERVRIVPNAIDLSPYENLPDKTILRKKLHLPINVPIVGHIGRFHPQKNHKFIIEIFSELIKQIPSAHLVLVGDGPLRKDIEDLVKQKSIEKNVHFLGIRKDIPEILGALDVFLFPSLYEGLGIVLIEAQAAGLPCIVSDVIPNDVNIVKGLIEFISLDSDINYWISQIRKKLLQKPSFKIQGVSFLKKSGYNISNTIESLSKIYSS
ncbi:MAG: hypothetical protein PWQ60_616 [Thermoanaerobacteraceae bacterium]|nr:hypothetical protein [Thermoanaerobacteraceae bacterium]